MAKKKKPHKKTRRARASVAPTAASQPSNPAPAPAAPVSPIPAVAATQAAPLPALPVVAPATPKPANRPIAIDRAAYVAGDLRRVGILIVVCIVLEAILWFLFSHTGLGNAIYRHINL